MNTANDNRKMSELGKILFDLGNGLVRERMQVYRDEQRAIVAEIERHDTGLTIPFNRTSGAL